MLLSKSPAGLVICWLLTLFTHPLLGCSLTRRRSVGAATLTRRGTM